MTKNFISKLLLGSLCGLLLCGCGNRNSMELKDLGQSIGIPVSDSGEGLSLTTSGDGSKDSTGGGSGNGSKDSTGVDSGNGLKNSTGTDSGNESKDSTGSDSGTELKAEAGADAKKDYIYVYVCGCVNNPGVVSLPKGSRAMDALWEAGGFTEDADTDYVNLAALLCDEQQLYFPTRLEVETGALPKDSTATAKAENSGLVNINTADATLLQTLPGIGASKAKAIVAYREEHGAFSGIEDLKAVTGIGDSIFSGLKDLICV